MGKERIGRGILQSVWRRLFVLLIILLLFPPVVEAALKEGITYSVTAVVGGFDVTITLPKDWCNFKFITCEDAQGEFYLKLGTERFPSTGTVDIRAGKSGTIRVTKEGTYTLMESELSPKPHVDLGTLYVDFTKPTSSITSPSAGSWQKSNFSVSISDSDTGSGLDKCEFKVVSSGSTTKDWTSRTCSTSITITVGSSKDCRHEGSNKCTVYARAKDKAGNLGDSVSRNFGIDWTAPSAPSVSSSSHPSQMVWYSNNDPSFSWTAPSDTSGIAGYSYILDQTSTTTPDTTVDTTGTSASYSNKADGTWYFHIKAKDNAGNWGSTAHYTAKIDTAAPSVSVSGAPANWQNTDATASVSCSDAGSGCDSATYKLKVYSSNPGSCPTSYSSYDLSSPQTISSHKWVCAAAKDNAGNTGFSSPVKFKVDKTAPSNPTTVTSTSHTTSTWSNDNTIDMSWSGASDADSGLYGYSYVFDTSSTTLPDTTVETTGTTATSSNLSDGNSWYFHIRTRDNAGNWNSMAVHRGPYYIDATSPPTPSGIIWDDGATSPDTTIVANWGDVSDTSGIVDYYLQVDVDSTDFSSGMIFNGLIGSTSSTKTLTSSNGVAFGHVYYYRVRAKNGAGLLSGWSSVSPGVSVAPPNQPPNASFTVTPTSGDTTTIFQVDASASTDDLDPVTSLQVRWDWENDGTWDTAYTTTKTASHQYTSAGTYTIKLEVKDTGGLTSTTSRQVTVSKPNNPPVAKIKAPTWVTQDKAFTLDGSESYDPDGDDLIYSWSDNYGDFSGVTGVKPSVTLYTIDHGEKKIHNITLTVSDGRGGVSTASAEITVIPPWAPTWWSDLEETFNTTAEIGFRQRFKWNQEHLDYLKALNADYQLFYQWELRRTPREINAWDFWKPNSIIPLSGCSGSAYTYTNLPDWDYDASEEYNLDLRLYCPQYVYTVKGERPYISRADEEFEFRSGDVDRIQTDFEYFARVSFLRKDTSQSITVDTESEYCGKLDPYCNWGADFGYYLMTRKVGLMP